MSAAGGIGLLGTWDFTADMHKYTIHIQYKTTEKQF